MNRTLAALAVFLLGSTGSAVAMTEADMLNERSHMQTQYAPSYPQYNYPQYSPRYYRTAPTLSERQLRRTLRHQGYHDIGNLRWRGDVVRVRATDPYGNRVRLTVSRATGQVIDRNLAYR